MVQAECILRNWADIQKSELYEEWLSAMRLELEGRNEIVTFSADVVPKGVNVITAKWVFTWKTDSDGCITKAKARLVWLWTAVWRGLFQHICAHPNRVIY